MLVRIAIGSEFALSSSQTAVNLEITDLEFEVIKNLAKRWTAACLPSHDTNLPMIQIMEIPRD